MKQQTTHHIADSCLAYLGGGCLISLSFAELALLAQQIGFIVGLLVMSIKLFYDLRRVWKDIKNHLKNKK